MLQVQAGNEVPACLDRDLIKQRAIPTPSSSGNAVEPFSER